MRLATRQHERLDLPWSLLYVKRQWFDSLAYASG
jgi:hypothetical protein